MVVALIIAGVVVAGLGLAWLAVLLANKRARTKAGQAMTAKALALAERGNASAAPVLVSQGRFQEALDLLISVNDYKGAARVALRMGSFTRAAEMFERLGDFEGAGNAHFKVPDLRRAAQCFSKAGNHDRAADIYLQISDLWSAAEERAAGGRLDLAAKLQRELGNEHNAVMLEAEAQRKAGEPAKAAACLAALGEHAKAAECFAEAGLHKDAVQQWIKAGKPELGAALLEKTGALGEAAALYEEAGDHANAARLYAAVQNPDGELAALIAAGEALAAGHLAYKLGRKGTAEEVLRTAKPQDRGYARACLLLGRLLEESGRVPEALKYFGLFVERASPAGANRAVFEYLQGLFLREDDRPNARRTLKRMHEAGLLDAAHVAILQNLEAEEALEPDSPTAAPPSTPGGSPGLPPAPDRYRLMRHLGEGGTAVVWLATDQTLKRDVVLKYLQNPGLPADLAEDYFLREAQIIAGLSHPSIVQVYDLGTYQGRQYMVLEYLHGETLDCVLRRTPGHTLPLRKVAAMATELAAALAYAHEHNVIHRDIKPSNVMVLPDGHIKLMDFGMAKALEVHTDRSLYICGTPEYMSPEQEAGSDLTAATDIYSFALILAESLLGRLPTGNSSMQTRIARMEFVQKAVLPDEARRILMKCLAMDPSSRPKSPLAIAEALTRAAGPVRAGSPA